MMKKSIILPLKHLNNGEYGKIPDQENEAILHLADPMVQSFNYAVGQGLQTAVTNILPVEMTTPSNKKITISFTNVVFEKPRVPANDGSVLESRMFPRHCLESQSTYQGMCTATIGWMLDDRRMPYVEMQLGGLPIMVKSDLCNIKGMRPAELLKRGEEVNDPGGYFIINGSKKIIRLLTAYRRNYPIALTRESWRHKQQFFTDKGITIQCVGRDETGITNVLHYLTTGAARLEFFINKRPFLIDMVMLLKAFRDTNDREIVMMLGEMRRGDTFFIEKVKQMLSDLASRGLYTSVQCRAFIGRSFRSNLRDFVPSYYTDDQVCELLIEQFIFIHLPDASSKFDLLCFMACKLYALIAGDTVSESLDVASMMEAHLSGFLYLKYLKEKLQDMLNVIKIQAFVFLKGQPIDYVVTEADFKKWCLRSRQVASTLESFISTGNVASKTGLGLSQASGLSIILEGLNRMRDLSHLRAIHRGSYFLEMKTVVPRRLTGEAWGFICPVHTPDGAPCGLLNHLAFNCKIPAHPPPNDDAFLNTLLTLGMQPMSATTRSPASAFLHLQYPVLLDGRLVGHVFKTDAKTIELKLRTMKTSGEVYQFTEVVMVLQRPHGGQFPGLYLFTAPGRMMRPVINLYTKSVEFIGTFEQVYLNIAISTDQIDKEVHSHVDVDKSQMFSNIGKLVPFSDCNPNPRNMYQCQMGKQTVGTPLHTWRSQMLNKAYRLQYPQVPLVRNAHYDVIDMQDHCMGFNAVLALVSYTGYDIEDAMTVNKSSMERGLGHCQIYKSEFVNLRNKKKGHQKSEVTHIFNRDPEQSNLVRFLDPMGLPVPGTLLEPGDPYYCTQDIRSRAYDIVYYKGEKCVVDKVALVEVGNKDSSPQKMSVTLRAQRNPNIGDKFASRSGQKGVMSRLYPTEDLPFSERGIMPDIIFNPHGIPSRMTAGKLLEVIAGKAAAEYGLSFDSTPFEFSDENPAADYFGSILEKAGFNYYGEDVMYSGIDGRMLEVKVYQGIMYYQRLKHMTEDKYQVRSTGTVDAVTRQPVKGRKRGGAIRFGEMERDALLAHGAAFMLKDRLLDCSDSALEWTCSQCGCMLSPKPMPRPGSLKTFKVPVCARCGPDAKMVQVVIPFAFKYMVAELASVGIATQLSLNDKIED